MNEVFPILSIATFGRTLRPWMWRAPLLAVLLLGLLLGGCKQSGGTGQKYHCPMHPTYVSDRPGDCPICGMKLVTIKGDKAPKKAATSAATPQTMAKVGQYYCPMDPNVVSNAPGKCPECHMKLLLKTNDVAAAAADTNHAARSNQTDQVPAVDHSGHEAAAATSSVPGRAEVTITADKQQLIGLRTSKVEDRELALTIRTTGVFEHDETRLSKVAPRFAGWVRDVKINFTGEAVAAGDPLLTVYSPDLLSAENEYLLAFERLRQLTNAAARTASASVAGDNDAANGRNLERLSAERLVESGRRRLSLWGIGDQEIREIETSGRAKDDLLIRAPSAGHVTAKAAVAGKAFMAGEALYEIADLSHLWLRASIYEYELPLVKMGQTASVVVPGGKTYQSTVRFIYPHIEQQSRRAELRLEFDNPRHELRPGMWADVVIEASHGKVLSVPASAVIDTGTRYLAFVSNGDSLQPREVKVGTRADDFWEIVSGLRPNEQVVTRALFLVDSESQLKAAIEGMGGEHH